MALGLSTLSRAVLYVLLLGVAGSPTSLRGSQNQSQLYFYIHDDASFQEKAAVVFCYESQPFCDFVVHIMVQVSGIHSSWNAVVMGSWKYKNVTGTSFPLIMQNEHEFALKEYVPGSGVQVVGTKNLVHYQGKIPATSNHPDSFCVDVAIASDTGRLASAPYGSAKCFPLQTRNHTEPFVKGTNDALSVTQDIKIEAKYTCSSNSSCVGFIANILEATPRSFAHPVSCGGDLALWNTSDYDRYYNTSNTSGLSFSNAGMFMHWHQDKTLGPIKCGVEWQITGTREEFSKRGFCVKLWIQDDATLELFKVPWSRTPGGPLCQQMVEQASRCTVDVDCPSKPGGPADGETPGGPGGPADGQTPGGPVDGKNQSTP